MHLWNTTSHELQRELAEHKLWIRSISWSPNRNILASGSADNTVQVWDPDKGKALFTLKGHNDQVFDIAWSPYEQMLASASMDGTICIWRASDGKLQNRLKGHSAVVTSLAWSPKNHILASASWDKTIRIWDPLAGKQITILENHSASVETICFSSDGQIFASKSRDKTIYLWQAEGMEPILSLNESLGSAPVRGLAFNPISSKLASISNFGTCIRIWNIDANLLFSKNEPIFDAIQYTTAKLVLFGDSGVGKTGLGWRLAHNEFKEHSSTHGQQFWVVPELKKTREDGTECEVVLWDLAGQPDYRLVHSLYLDDVDTALVLFDP